MRHLNEQGGDAVFSEAHAKELLNVQANYNKKLQELNNQLAKQKSDLAVKYMKISQQQQAATAAKAANTPTPTTSTTSTKQTGTVTTAGQPVNAQGNPPAVESINILRVKELNEEDNTKTKMQKLYDYIDYCIENNLPVDTQSGITGVPIRIEEGPFTEPYSIVVLKVAPGKKIGVRDYNIILPEMYEAEEERFTNPTYMGDKRNWYQKPESQVGYKTPRKPSKKRYKPWNFDTLGKYADIKGEIDDLKSELRDYNELFSAPDVYGGEVEEFFAEIGDNAAEILNSGAYKNDKEKLKALESIGVDNPKSILRTYYYYYPAFNPELDKERKQAEREIPKIQAKIKKLKAKLDKMDSIHESVNESDNSWEGYSSMDLEKEKEKYKRAISYYQNLFRSKGDYPERDEDKEEYKEVKQEYKELLAYMRSLKESSYRLDNVSTEDLQATKDYMDAENISYAEDEDGSTIDFDEDDFDEEMRDDLGNMGFEKDDDDILSIEDEDDQIQGEEDEDFVDMDEKIDEEKVFYVRVDDEGESFVGKIYKLFDEGDWRSVIAQGSSDTFEKINYDPDYDSIDIIAFLRENYDDAELLSEDEYNKYIEDSQEKIKESIQHIQTLEEYLYELSKSI